MEESRSAVGVWELRRAGEVETRDGYTIKEQISAFTAAELGEMLPNKIEADDDTFWLYTWKGQLGFMVGYGDVIHEISHTASFRMYQAEDADTEADARAKMLIYLIENSLITIG